MPRLARKWTAALLALTLCIVAAALWLVLRSRNASPNTSRPEVCEEWAKAETANQGLGWDLTLRSEQKKTPQDDSSSPVATYTTD